METRVGFVGFFVHDLEAATAYYRDGLGLPQNEAQSLPGQYAQFDLPGASLALFHIDLAPDKGAPYELGLLVADADAAFAAWKARGVACLEAAPVDMPFGRTFRLHTPSGHPVRVIQPAGAAAQS